jgi:hypothetical protein
LKREKVNTIYLFQFSVKGSSVIRIRPKRA